MFVWRADARTADITGARISRDTMFEWSAASFSGLKESFKKKVPDDVYRAAPLARIELRLDPEKPLNEEKQMAEHWEELQAAPPPAPDVYEAALAEQWRQIGCSTQGAPYVLARLIRYMDYSLSPFSPGSPQVPQLAAEFLKDNCAGASGLSDDEKGRLKALRDRGAQKPPNPSAQGPQP